MTGLLDVILHYDCNLACDYCTITPAMRRRGLTTAAVLRELTAARADGYDRLSITGGEPTTRGDLLGLVRAARRQGYRGVKVQTNGLVLDGFLGSASTLVACEQLGRICYGIELEPKFIDVAVKRYIELKGAASDVYVERDGGKIAYDDVPKPEEE